MIGGGKELVYLALALLWLCKTVDPIFFIYDIKLEQTKDRPFCQKAAAGKYWGSEFGINRFWIFFLQVSKLEAAILHLASAHGPSLEINLPYWWQLMEHHVSVVTLLRWGWRSSATTAQLLVLAFTTQASGAWYVFVTCLLLLRSVWWMYNFI